MARTKVSERNRSTRASAADAAAGTSAATRANAHGRKKRRRRQDMLEVKVRTSSSSSSSSSSLPGAGPSSSRPVPAAPPRDEFLRVLGPDLGSLAHRTVTFLASICKPVTLPSASGPGSPGSPAVAAAAPTPRRFTQLLRQWALKGHAPKHGLLDLLWPTSSQAPLASSAQIAHAVCDFAEIPRLSASLAPADRRALFSRISSWKYSMRNAVKVRVESELQISTLD